VHGPKKTEAQIQRQRDELNRAVIAAVSSTRKDVDVTQAGLAEQMAWSREIVSNIEQGRRDVTVADLVLIARALDVDPEKLFRRILRW
jgi:transcriptional regulator with XRE-family HTH domain